MARLSIGLDIGHHQVRAVALAPARAAELREGARARVVATAAVSRLDGDGHPKPLAAALAEIETMLGRRGAVSAHLGDGQTLVRFVPTMALPPEKRQRLLRLELIQHADERGDLAADAWQVPVPGEEIIHGCIIGQPAAILGTLDEMRIARLPTPAVSYAPAAMANIVPPGELEGDQLALVIDIGLTTTGVTLVGDGRLLACRQVPMGGDAFTEALMAGGLDRAAAERRKTGGEPPAAPVPVPAILPAPAGDPASSGLLLDVPLTDGSLFDAPVIAPAPAPERKRVADASFDAMFEDEPPAASAPSPAVPAPLRDMPPSLDEPTIDVEFEDRDGPAPPAAAAPVALPPLPLPSGQTVAIGRAALGTDLQRTAEALYAQIASSVLWFKTQLRLEKLPIDRVMLVGGGSGLAGLDAYFQRRFNAPVQVLDPFARLAGGPASEHAGGWAAAVALALADPRLGGRDAIRLDLRPESLVRADFRRRHQIWPYVAAACLVAATAVAGAVLLRNASAEEASVEAYAQWKAKRDELDKRLGTFDANKAALSEDLRAVASRIYAGRDLLYAVRALKEQALESKELWVTRLETKGIGTDPTIGDALVERTQAAPARGHDSAIERGALLISGRVRFSSASTDVGRDQFIKTWREKIAAWKPAPDAPLLFLRQRVVLWDPNHRPAIGIARPGAKEDGEFPFQVEFTFRSTQLDQITASHAGEGGR